MKTGLPALRRCSPFDSIKTASNTLPRFAECMTNTVKRMLNRVLGSRIPDAGPTLGLSSELSTSDLEHYYLRIVMECLRRLLVPADSIEVEIKRTADPGPGGKPGYSGRVRILRWDPMATPALLQNMPVIDARIRKLVQASILLEHTHFAGLWFQATSLAEGAPCELGGAPTDLIHQAGWVSR